VIEGKLASGAAATGSAAPASHAVASSGSDDSVAPFVTAFDELVANHLQPYLATSKKLGAADVVKQAELVLAAAQKQRELLVVASKSKKPDDQTLQKLLGPTQELLKQVNDMKDSKEGRTSKFFNNLATVAEGIPAFMWVCVAPTPAPYVGEMKGSSEFYSNRILKEFKGKEQLHVDWVASFNGFLKDLQAYVKAHHTTGLSWNPRGGDASSAAASSSSSAAAPSSVPPPPGPAPPPPASAVTNSAPAPDMSNVFSALNKGEGVTSGLKKVTNDMKAKNMTDKPALAPKEKTTTAAPKATAAKVTKPPKFSLDGNKWSVEFQVGNKDLVINETESKQTVYIYKCSDSVIQVKGKVNAITLDDCSKTSVVFDTCIASFEVVNCKGVEVQVTGQVPSVAIDKTTGIQLYLSKTSLHTELTTSKSDAMNVLLPTADGDFEEKPVPEQYRTVVRDGKLVTECSSHV
jgi:adenylyl cyclase-associated protein